MKRSILTITLTVVLTLSLSCSRNTGTPDSISSAGITQKLNEWVELWNTYNLDSVDNLFLQTDELSYFSSEKTGIIRGIDAVRDHHRGFGFVPGGKPSDSRLWLEEISADIFGNSALVTGIWYFQRNTEAVQRGPVTILYVNRDAGLKIAHMNFGNYE